MSLPKNGTVGGPNIAILFKSTNDGKVLMQDFTNISPISNCHPWKYVILPILFAPKVMGQNLQVTINVIIVPIRKCD